MDMCSRIGWRSGGGSGGSLGIICRRCSRGFEARWGVSTWRYQGVEVVDSGASSSFGVGSTSKVAPSSGDPFWELSLLNELGAP